MPSTYDAFGSGVSLASATGINIVLSTCRNGFVSCFDTHIVFLLVFLIHLVRETPISPNRIEGEMEAMTGHFFSLSTFAPPLPVELHFDAWDLA